MHFAAGMSKSCSLDEIRLSANSSELSAAIDSRNVLFPACCNGVSSSHSFISHILCRDFVRIQESEVSMALDASSPLMLYFFPVGPTNLAGWIEGWERFLRAAEMQDRGCLLSRSFHKISASSREIHMDRDRIATEQLQHGQNWRFCCINFSFDWSLKQLC